ncbi:NAD(P)/FAD-dependent oxidoreductase [Kribbella speibonae]|uniref:NAD(P)/FAD-dependent oxidoreductase n=1 Tax=Kribbella speibonae TaxID=1572660 RepID=A0A4R0ISC0_9ACTN|nr:NAD(P)/FAD-dependent oxidoreductase [Kribbella speibonae]TCC27099.1 NAD(P)/FAD-dependent oxidoreductase [Kribbella speibonae]TCC36049.1 NAD(P)/FAD-dependent oxidoreductase [Kribbella speibonae]
MDVAVVGGSVAGLQVALTLGRARRRVVLFDDGRARNRAASHVHNFLGVEDLAPGELLAVGRRQVAAYGVEVRDLRVDDVDVDGDEFVVGGERVRAVVLATGLWDELPDVQGVADGWGQSVVACPHCHGWEVRDQPLVQIGMRGAPERSVARGLLLSRWSDDVTLCTDGDELTAVQVDQLVRAGVAVRTEPVKEVREGYVLLDGVELLARRVFVVVRQHQQSDLAERLGCQVADGAVVTDEGGRTTMPGVYAVGTTTSPALLAIGAAGHASTAAVAVHADLLDLDLGGGR